MRSFIATGIFLGLGFLAAASRAEDIQWRSAGNPATPAAGSPAASASAPIVTLSRPVPIRSATKTSNDPAIKPASFEAAPITRTKADEVRSPELVTPLPFGPTLTSGQQKPATEEIPVRPSPLATPQTSRSLPQTSGSFFGRVMLDGDAGVVSDDPCAGDCCGAFTDCCLPRGRLWVSTEYLLWGVKAQNAPPLLTTSPAGTPLAVAGILGQPTTSNLWDRNNLPGDLRSGGRFTIGFWLPRRDDIGLEASYFFLGQISNNFAISSNGSPILMRPFTEAVPNTPLAIPTAFPGVVAGSFGVNANSYLWGAEANLRKKLCCSPCGYLDLLVGYRHYQLQDGIDIHDVERPLAGPPGQPAFLVSDSFFTRNQFNGGQIGLDAQWNFWRRWYIGATAKVAIGDVHQSVTISGSTSGAATAPFGVLALPTNIGTFSRDRFGVLPAGTLKLGYTFNDHWRAWVGYDFLYLSSVVRAGDQIDLTLNHNFLPGGTNAGPARPAVVFTNTGFWAQGASFGLEYRW
jgi:hypothetical protein